MKKAMRTITQAESREYYRKLYHKKENISQIERIDRKDHQGRYLLVIIDDDLETLEECIVRYTTDEMLEIETLKQPLR